MKQRDASAATRPDPLPSPASAFVQHRDDPTVTHRARARALGGPWLGVEAAASPSPGTASIKLSRTGSKPSLGQSRVGGGERARKCAAVGVRADAPARRAFEGGGAGHARGFGPVHESTILSHTRRNSGCARLRPSPDSHHRSVRNPGPIRRMDGGAHMALSDVVGGIRVREPRAESREPRAESREPRAESREPRAESREPRAESREPRAESREPRAESREPRAESREPRAESREPRAESREPRAESREPRAESREPRAESREPRAESREPRAESREPRAESREPRAESREPRAESRELRPAASGRLSFRTTRIRAARLTWAARTAPGGSARPA